ncbi:glycerate kinase [Geodermatophilus sp. SYSU D00766]
MRILIAPDKFRGTATAVAAAAALAEGVADAGHTAIAVPLADGGEGTLEALGGATHTTRVTGPLGAPVDAAWRLSDGRAVVETARASGLLLAGGREANDPWAATSRGTGELVAEAVRRGARRVVVGVGGSACTDGGAGAVEVLREIAPLDGSRGWTVQVACDVGTTFLDAARVFGPQKGATPELVRRLTARLADVALDHRERYGVDVRALPGSGAAGGLAGGLAALGASLVPGFDLVADVVGLRERVRAADLVVTGEGMLDVQSFEGKVVGGVAALARAAGVPWAAVVGQALVDPPDGRVVDLVATFGRDRALGATSACLRTAGRDLVGPVTDRAVHDGPAAGKRDRRP